MSAKGEFACTDIQMEIMRLVVEAAARGRNITLKELLTQLSHQPKRSALHSSIRFLKRHSLVETINRGRAGGYVVPTATAMAMFKKAPTP
jgi:hypothetical protein